MSKTTETALELDVAAAGYSRGEGVHFGGFPGVWFPERPIAVSELGFQTDDDALAAVAERELPLRKVKVAAGSAPMPERPNHVLSQLEVPAEEQADDGEPAAEQAPAEEEAVS